jgi:hypothetical protein
MGGSRCASVACDENGGSRREDERIVNVGKLVPSIRESMFERIKAV